MNNKEHAEVFCKNVKILREQNHLSKKEMAEILGVGVATLAKIEQGIIPPKMSVKIIFRLSQRFHIQEHKLFIDL